MFARPLLKAALKPPVYGGRIPAASTLVNCLLKPQNGGLSRFLSTAAKTVENQAQPPVNGSTFVKPGRTLRSKSRRIEEEGKTVVVTQKNVQQSPLKMRFLVMLIRNKWMPDALAQMKFTPKRKGVDIAKMLNRANALHRIYHSAIPEELWIKDVITTKGVTRMKMRYKGRGRRSTATRRATKVRITVEVIDFPQEIANARSRFQRRRWEKRYEIVKRKRENPGSTSIQQTPK